jgi:transcriptional regulator with XRE-family HTH domain
MTERQREWLTRPGGVAERLGELRAAAGLDGKGLAEKLGWTTSKVSRVQTGATRPSPADLVAWAAATGASQEATQELLALLDEVERARREFGLKMGRGQTAVQAAHNDWTARSTLIRYFDHYFIPGWFQTREYAHRVLSEMIPLHQLQIDDVDAAVAKRLQRQHMLYDTDKQFEIIITEWVLRAVIIEPAAMRAQLDRLQTAVDLPNVRFGIIPQGVLLRTITPQNSFQTYDDLPVIEGFHGEEELDDNPRAAAQYARVMEMLWEEAAVGPDARRLIIAAADALPS